MNPLSKFIGPAESLPKEIQLEVIQILQKLISLDFSATFVKLEEGPVVRTYYFEPAGNALLSKVMGKSEDIALSLKVESVVLTRELNLLSIQVPRADRQIIRFDNLLFKLFQSESAKQMILPILMGQTPKGEDIYCDLTNQPHLLIAGSTNSGKSVFVSQCICSLALFNSPEDLKFTLVDTKQLDLTLFNGLPHIGDVVQDIHSLREKLSDLLDLVRSRTAQMSGVVRNVREWNSAGLGPKYQYHVLIIDEFADVVDSDREYIASLKPSVRPQPIDTLVRRLAQISRAAGVHIILATQRPSVKLLSGDIKTNFPSRISFKLPTMQDSRVVLDENGAEKLLGMGDYLYKIAGSDSVKRAHSAYVSVNDIATIISQSEMLREQYVQKEAK